MNVSKMMALVTNISWPQTIVGVAAIIAKYRKGMTFFFTIVLAFFGVLIEFCDYYGYYKIENLSPILYITWPSLTCAIFEV